MSKLLSMQLRKVSVVNLLSQRNSRKLLKNSTVTLRKVPVPAKDTPSKKDIKISKFHSSVPFIPPYSKKLLLKLLPTKLLFTNLLKVSADKPILTRNTRFTLKSSLPLKKEPVLPKDTPSMMELKTSKFHSLETSKLLFTPRPLPKEKLIKSLISGMLMITYVDKLPSPRNTRPTLRISLKLSRKVNAPTKDIPLNKNTKMSQFHLSVISNLLCSLSLLSKLLLMPFPFTKSLKESADKPQLTRNLRTSSRRLIPNLSKEPALQLVTPKMMVRKTSLSHGLEQLNSLFTPSQRTTSK